MQSDYDDQNIFAKILRKEIPCETIDECEHTLSFKDISPQADIHILVIPKGPYTNMTAFSATASADEKIAFFSAISRVIDKMGIAEDGYRLIVNTGKDGHQDVPHLHAHILGGRPLGAMIGRLI